MISIFKPKTSLLLALLVITGLAGRPSFETLSGAERRFLTQHLRDSKTELIKSIKGLSEEQLNYRPASGQWSVKECVQHLAVTEKELWKKTEALIKQGATEAKQGVIKYPDVELLQNLNNGNQLFQATEACVTVKPTAKAGEEALGEFKQNRNHLIKFARSTTDNLRDYVSVTPAGALDAYQLLLIVSAHTQKHIQQIEDIKKDKGFPKE